MAKQKILTVPDPFLKQVSKPVEQIDSKIIKLVDDLIDTMLENDAAGLAAPQIGVGLRVFVFDLSYKYPEEFPDLFVIINPEIYWKSEETYQAKEGCMSIPDIYFDVERYKSIKIRYLDKSGEKHDITCDGIMAHVMQHETDHLDGILSIDRISKFKREIYMRKLRKAKQLDLESQSI